MLRCFLAGVRFLTIIPVPAPRDDDGTFLAGSLPYFSSIGFVIGAIAAVAALILSFFVPALVSAALLGVTLSLLSGFLHLDGLADSADGFLSSRPAEKCLEIMKDSRTGVMGCAAVCSVLLVKTTALASLPGSLLTVGLIVAATAGRTAIVCSMAVLPYARTEGGLGTIFYRGSEKTAAFSSLILLLIVTLGFAPARVMSVAISFLFVCLAFSIICKRRIGGVTGDTLGAVCELAETAVLISFTI